MDQHKIHHCVETLCQKGCLEVLKAIKTLEHGHVIEASKGMDDEETAAVLSELKSIMAVYQQTPTGCEK